MAKIGQEYKATAREIHIDTHGLGFLCIIGKHINGAYIAVVNFGLSAELSTLDDIPYNARNILNALQISTNKWLPKSNKALEEIADEIAEAINEYIK